MITLANIRRAIYNIYKRLEILESNSGGNSGGSSGGGFSGDYNDLINKPTIPAAQIQSDWNQTNSSSADYIKNKPTIPAAQVQSDWNESDNTSKAYIANKPSLFSGSYNDLSNKPTIPDAQIQSDWNQSDSTAKDFIKNKPTIPTAQEVPTKLSDLQNDKNFLESPKYNYVEIGGIKWATMNIGASSETDIGLYFQWGDTDGYSSSQVGSGSGQKSFKWADYKYGNGTNSPGASGMSKYNSKDGKTTLEDNDDASKVILKGSWRLPTQEEFQTLISSTTRSWKSNYNSTGIKGMLLTSKADSNIKLFFPIGGFAYDNGISSSNSDGFYLSSTLASNKTEEISLQINSGNFFTDGFLRCRGHLIRAVLDESSSNLLSKVAQTGSYNDLSNKPTIPTVPSSETAVSGGSTLSLVTTGEKYTWNNKANIWRGTQAEYDLLTPDNNTIYIITSAS